MIESEMPEKLIESKFIKKRKLHFSSILPPYTLIISEGAKTEPYYINGFASRINAKYSKYCTRDRIKVIGMGRNTSNLLKYAKRFVEQPENNHFQNIWLMYDKDDFPSDNFDNTEFSIRETNYPNKKFFAAWSNECIELWFLLHFQDLQSNIKRDQYIKILRKYFDYEKNLFNIYDILNTKGDVYNAISRAKELLNDNYNSSPSKIAPATKVYLLVEELMKYL